ncbi:hypothetical protein F0562_011746 [Nyssa sinensis]|uniref:Disease resistance R13L4/SHOC-2-like LRR domain-containing protein n=1 Tax=Nyssa sinensis TaxID=561372 RepID=A0A5J4ZVE4_9ASTE|nr:hypothetical protein F0562_011746 [Nyssa sinensis]
MWPTNTEDVLDEFMLCLAHHLVDGFYGFLYQGSTSTTVANNPCYDHRRGDALLLEEAEVVGIDRHKKQLIKWLVEDNPRFKVISVVGIGGLGKTTLVLDLRGTFLETVLNEVVKLFHLKYLSLRGTNVKMLPKSIGNLQKLETLDLKGTYVTELPIEIQKLQQLRHLLVYRYNTTETYVPFHHRQGFKVQAKIGALLSLQKLCYIEANHFRGGLNMVEELGRLTQLKRLGIEKLTRENGMALCSSIAKLRNLQSLSITSTKEDEITDLQSLSSAP